MKKILSFLIILGAITFVNIDLFASSYHGITLDTQLQELNSYSLRDVFDTNNLIQNHDFSNGLNNWDLYGFTSSFNNNILTLTGDGTLTYPYIRQQNVFNSTDYFYVNVNVKTNKQVQAIKIEASTNDSIIYNPTDDIWYDLSYIRQPVSYTSLVVQLLDSTVYTNNYYLDIEMGIYVINLSYLNLQLDISQLNYYFEVYKVLSFYENGYNVGYDDGNLNGYNDGYDDGLFDYHTGNYYGQYDYTLSEPYDQATQANISLLSVFSLIIGVVMSMLGFIINIEMFGISIASILGTLAIGVSIIWLLKLIRG